MRDRNQHSEIMKVASQAGNNSISDGEAVAGIFDQAHETIGGDNHRQHQKAVGAGFLRGSDSAGIECE